MNDKRELTTRRANQDTHTHTYSIAGEKERGIERDGERAIELTRAKSVHSKRVTFSMQKLCWLRVVWLLINHWNTVEAIQFDVTGLVERTEVPCQVAYTSNFLLLFKIDNFYIVSNKFFFIAFQIFECDFH